MDKILKIVNGVMPLLTDTKPSGDRKASIGRICALLSAGLILYRFGYLGQDPGTGILAFFASAMTYNAVSKTSVANGNGGEAVTQPSTATPAPSEGQDD
jgi:hypothetical protein